MTKTFFFRNTIVVLSSFLDAFQKIADAATNTKGKLARFIVNNIFTFLLKGGSLFKT